MASLSGSVDAYRRRTLLAPVSVAVVLLTVFAVYLPTTLSMGAVWATSGTYTHGFLAIPISLLFVWVRREELAQIAPYPYWPALLAIAGAGALWLLGDLSASLSLSHFGLVALAISAVIAVFGLQWARVLAFPLAVLLFAVPVGDAFVPALMDWTADFTVAALKASSVPVLREGNHITIPSGRWSVVEACSGARYLLASFMVGTLYAWFMYRSPVRRAAFMVASLIVPIVANWFRAYAIVMLGHLSSNKLATGVDHFIYGWVFFGLFVFAMFAVGLRWRQDQSLDLELPVAAARFNGGSPPALATAGAAAFVLAAAWPALAALLLSFVDARPLSPVLIEAQSGWMPADEADDGWRPQLAAPRAERWQAFQRNGQRVNVHIGYFRGQSQLSELVNSEHRLVLAEGDDWRVVAGGISTALLAAREVTVRSALLQNARGRYIRIWQWYWLGERNTSSDVLAKVDLALDRLLLRSDASAWIAVATTHDPERPDYSDRVLREFVAGMSATIHEALKATAER